MAWLFNVLFELRKRIGIKISDVYEYGAQHSK